jgi:hypothetical protein
MNYILLAAIIIAAITSVAAIEAMPCTYEDRLDDMIHTTGGSILTETSFLSFKIGCRRLLLSVSANALGNIGAKNCNNYHTKTENFVFST